MIKNILQLLEETSNKFPNKIAFGEDEKEITYDNMLTDGMKIGSYIANNANLHTDLSTNQPIVIFIDKTINCLKAMFGVLYSGNFYTIIDTKSPKDRMQSIIDTLEPIAIITDVKNKTKLERCEIKTSAKVFIVDEMIEENINKNKLLEIRDKQIDTDIMYILFTSGSTGIPKGTVLTHRAVITYINWVKDTFEINENTVWGSQTPFYFSMSITDVFSTILTGASLYIIPKMLFSFPIKLIEFLNEKKVNTIYWVPSALSLVANLGALKEKKIENLSKVLFAGEVMPTKQLNMWIEEYPNIVFANLYGPTETTDICSYYVVNRKFKNDESIPIGEHCNNCDLLIIDENNTEIKLEKDKNGNYIESKSGELYVRGSFLASGYYKNKLKTEEVFVQNPLNNKYPEVVYKTGDIVKYNNLGEIIYLSRKDYQIKHMGYRIELGEIERNIYGLDEITLCATIYDEESQKIVLYYQGEINENELAKKLSKLLLPYMRPNVYKKLEHMSYNSNGKIDRKKLKSDFKGEK